GERRIVADVEGHEGDRLFGGSGGGRLLAKDSPPGLEGGVGQAGGGGEGTGGQGAGGAAVAGVSAGVFLSGVAGFALWHEQDLRDRVKEDHVPKVTTLTRTGPTGRLPPSRARATPAAVPGSSPASACAPGRPTAPGRSGRRPAPPAWHGPRPP